MPMDNVHVFFLLPIYNPTTSKPSPPQHGPTKNPGICNTFEKIEERFYRLHLTVCQ